MLFGKGNEGPNRVCAVTVRHEDVVPPMLAMLAMLVICVVTNRASLIEDEVSMHIKLYPKIPQKVY